MDVLTDFIPKGTLVKTGGIYYKTSQDAPEGSPSVTIADHGFFEEVPRRKIKKVIPLKGD